MLFNIGVALVAIIPRLPNDPPFPYAIGGDLSYNFRRVLLGLTLSNVIRILCFEGASGPLAVMIHPLKTLGAFCVPFYACLLRTS
jgi:hypothetical protein